MKMVEEEIVEEEGIAEELAIELKREILEILRAGVNVDNKKEDWIWDTEQREIMEEKEVTQFWEDTEEEFKTDSGNQLKANFNKAYADLIRKHIRYNGKPLEYKDFQSPNLDIFDITFTPIKGRKWEQFVKKLPIFKQTHSEFLVPADIERLDDIVERLEDWFEKGASIDDIERAELIPEQLIRGFLNFEIREDRERIYTYWRKIAKRYNPMMKSIEAFKGSARDSNLDQELIDKIQTLPGKGELIPYIGLVPATKQDLQSIEIRLKKWMEFVQQAHAQAKNIQFKGSTKKEPRDLKDLTIASRARRGQKMREGLHELDRNEFDEEVADFQMIDPIFKSLLETGFNFPIKKFEIAQANPILNKWLDMARKRGIPDLEKIVHKKTIEIELQAQDQSTGERNYFLPLTSWVEENYTPSELGEVFPEQGQYDIDNPFRGTEGASKINKVTTKFFNILADILFEMKGQEKVQLPEGKFQTGPSTKAGTSPPPVSLQTPRYTEGVDPVLRELNDNNLKDKLEKMLKLLDSYYFTPIMAKTSLFIHEIPPGFASDIQGSHSFNLVGIEFSNHPIIRQLKDIHATLEDNVNMGSISKIRDYLKQEASSEKQHNTEKYIEDLEELVKHLVAWFEDEQWALEYVAFQLHLYLIGKQSAHTLENLTIKGQNAQELFDSYNKRGERTQSIIYALRSFLKHPRFQKLIREQEAMGINVSKYETVTNDILNLTEPENVNRVPEFTKALLETHDVVRKMNGKEVIYATLSLSDIDAMNYIITKMETKYRVDITANDVVNIVESNSAFEVLSDNYGLSKDIIYEIKGLCR